MNWWDDDDDDDDGDDDDKCVQHKYTQLKIHFELSLKLRFFLPTALRCTLKTCKILISFCPDTQINFKIIKGME
jgi:Pyruvate/2-oxoacid:ferredoxin oxidoreductase delta subunit